MISLQQRSPHGATLTPHFFNHGDTTSERERRKISLLIDRATDLQLPGTPKRSEYAYPCQDPKSHPERTGISQRPTLLNELERSTSFALTVHTIPYPQGHAGLQLEGNPPTTTPFLFDKDDASPVYCLMHQTYSEDRHRNDIAGISAVPKLAAPDTEEIHVPPLDLTSRKAWGSDLGIGNKTPHWQRVILIQDGTAPGFPQAPIRIRQGSTSINEIEEYKGHVLEVLIKVEPCETVGNVIHKLLLKCYPQPATVPAPHTLRYTLGDFFSHVVWTQEQTPADSPHLHIITGTEMSLSYEDKLEWITIKDSTIIAFLPTPDSSGATSPRWRTEESDKAQSPEQIGATESTFSNTLDQGET